MRVRGLGDGSNGLTKCEGERGVLLCRGLLITLSVWVGIISLSLVPYPDIAPLCEHTHTHTHTQKHTHTSPGSLAAALTLGLSATWILLVWLNESRQLPPPWLNESHPPPPPSLHRSDALLSSPP